MSHYCHNCHVMSDLPDFIHCSWCLEFWRLHHRMPLKSDLVKPETSLTRVYAAMGWDYPL